MLDMGTSYPCENTKHTAITRHVNTTHKHNPLPSNNIHLLSQNMEIQLVN